MANKRNKTKDYIYVIGVIVIFVAGFSIYFYHFVKGENLFSKKPDFDFSQYLDTDSFNPIHELEMMELAEEVKKKAGQQKYVQAEEEDEGIYFTKFFLKEDPIATHNFIKDFWQDFNASSDIVIEDLYAKNCFLIEIPVEDREQTLEKLSADENIQELKVAEPPYWQLCYKKSYYPEQVANNYASDDIKFIIESTNDEYIARIDNDLSDQDLEKVEELYSDVIEIKE